MILESLLAKLQKGGEEKNVRKSPKTPPKAPSKSKTKSPEINLSGVFEIIILFCSRISIIHIFQ